MSRCADPVRRARGPRFARGQIGGVLSSWRAARAGARCAAPRSRRATIAAAGRAPRRCSSSSARRSAPLVRVGERERGLVGAAELRPQPAALPSRPRAESRTARRPAGNVSSMPARLRQRRAPRSPREIISQGKLERRLSMLRSPHACPRAMRPQLEPRPPARTATITRWLGEEQGFVERGRHRVAAPRANEPEYAGEGARSSSPAAHGDDRGRGGGIQPTAPDRAPLGPIREEIGTEELETVLAPVPNACFEVLGRGHVVNMCAGRVRAGRYAADLSGSPSRPATPERV